MLRTLLITACLQAACVLADPAAAPAPAADAAFDAALARAATLLERGEHAASRELYAALALEHPDRPEPLNGLAAVAAATGDLATARALLDRALATHPGYRTIHENLARVFDAEAAAAYRKALPVAGPAPTPPKLVLLRATVAPVVAVAVPIAQPEVSRAGAAAAPATVALAETEPVLGVGAVVAPVAPAIPAVQGPRPLDALDRKALAIFAAVDAWIGAWVARDVPGYLAAYAPAYVPPDGLSRTAWSAQRAERIRAPKRIEIALEQRHLVIDKDGRSARMTFVQRYRSDRFNGDSFKTLTLVEVDGAWRIAGERTGR